MANITPSGNTGYPGVIDTRTILTNGPAGDLIIAEHPNGLGAAVLAIENELGIDPAGSAVDLVTRLAVALNNDGTVKTGVIQGASAGVVTYASGVFTIVAGIENIGSSNCGLIASRSPSANTVTLFLVTGALATPTAASPVVVSFSDTPITGGGNDQLTITSALTTVISSGSSAGMIANQPGRIYVGLINAAGTPELCWWNPLETNATAPYLHYSQYGFSESELQTTTAEGGIGAADLAGVLYSTTVRNSVPFKTLGYIDITMGASPGTWSNNPTAVRVLGAGMKRTGDVIQRVATQTSFVATGAGAIPNDNSIPQQGEGDLWMAATMTASNPANLWRIRAHTNQASGAIGRQAMGVWRFGVADAMGATRSGLSASNVVDALDLELYSTVTSGAVGFQVRGGDNAGATTTLNGEAGARLYNGALISYLTIEEVCT